MTQLMIGDAGWENVAVCEGETRQPEASEEVKTGYATTRCTEEVAVWTLERRKWRKTGENNPAPHRLSQKEQCSERQKGSQAARPTTPQAGHPISAFFTSFFDFDFVFPPPHKHSVSPLFHYSPFEKKHPTHHPHNHYFPLFSRHCACAFLFVIPFWPAHTSALCYKLWETKNVIDSTRVSL